MIVSSYTFPLSSKPLYTVLWFSTVHVVKLFLSCSLWNGHWHMMLMVHSVHVTTNTEHQWQMVTLPYALLSARSSECWLQEMAATPCKPCITNHIFLVLDDTNIVQPYLRNVSGIFLHVIMADSALQWCKFSIRRKECSSV